MRNKSLYILIVPAVIVTIFMTLLISKELVEGKLSLHKTRLKNNLSQIKTQVKALIATPTIVNNNLVSTSSATLPASSSATASPSAKLSFEQMNNLYGPCVKLSVLMYHHVQEEADAKAKKQTGLTTTPEFFLKHMQYLKDKGYSVVTPSDLAGFFNGTNKIPNKSAMITLDDGYYDNYQYAYPILKQFGFHATVFTPTGLLNNPGYLSWQDMNNMKDLVSFGNHTWSHHSSSGTKEEQEKEIGMANQQLNEHGFNSVKSFAYPYGPSSNNAEQVLKEKGYTMAFTTVHGNIMCKGKYLDLPRIRVGNAPLNNYGL